MVDRANVLECPIDRLDMMQTLARCEQIVHSGGYTQHMAINAAKLVAMREDSVLRQIITECGLVNADGQAVVWASRLLGDPLPSRVAGIDLMSELFALAERRRWCVYILGAQQHVLDEAVANIRKRHPALRIGGYRNGWFADTDSDDVVDDIRAAGPDILFVGMSSPRKEYWLARYGPALGVPLVMGVGGAIDVAAGVTRRAPRWMQTAGLEWLYRLRQEPRRLGPRYLRTNGRFVLLTIRAIVERRRRSARVVETGRSMTSAWPETQELEAGAAAEATETR